MTELELYNLALDAAGGRRTLSSTAVVGREGDLCRRWFALTRDQVLSAGPWPNARAQARLALLATRDENVAWTSADPTPGWLYAYAAPADMLRPRYDTTYSRFHLGVHAGQAAIMSQTENAILTYTARVTNIDLWDVELKIAIAYALAAHITMPLYAKPARAEINAVRANNLILQARINAANAEEALVETMPEWLSARGYGGELAVSRYIYPYGPMISVLEGIGVT